MEILWCFLWVFEGFSEKLCVLLKRSVLNENEGRRRVTKMLKGYFYGVDIDGNNGFMFAKSYGGYIHIL